MQRILRAKAGVPAQQLSELSTLMEVPHGKLLAWTGISSAKDKRMLRVNGALNLGESERVLGLARLVGLVAKIVAESGTIENFNAASWTARWLDRPNPSLGGRNPGELMSTADGRQLVESLAAMMQSGAYA